MERGIKHNTHPGELLYEEIIKAHGLTIQRAAELLGVTRTALSNIINQKAAITPFMALRLQTVFGGSASFSLKLQSSYDLRKAQFLYYNNPPDIRKFERT